MTVATDEEMRAAVERWARAKGWAWHDAGHWTVWWTGTRPTISIAARLDRGGAVRELSPHAALVWALVLEARPLRDGSRCKRCRGRGTWDEWSRIVSGYDPIVSAAVDSGRRVGRVAVEWIEHEHGHEVRAVRTVPCPDCDGTGLADLTDAYAQHVLDAQPKANPIARGFVAADVQALRVSVCADYSDPAAIEALLVLSDRLQPDLMRRADGPPRDLDREALGLYIAHLLAGSREGTANAVEALRRRVTPAPRRAGRLVTVLRSAAYGLIVEHVHRRVLETIRFADLGDSGIGAMWHTCLVNLADSAGQRAALHVGPSTSLHDLARQLDQQTYGLTITVNTELQRIEVIEHAHGETT